MAILSAVGLRVESILEWLCPLIQQTVTEIIPLCKNDGKHRGIPIILTLTNLGKDCLPFDVPDQHLERNFMVCSVSGGS